MTDIVCPRRSVSAVAGCGTDMLELDCHLSRDGRVVVAHDPHLRRAGQPELAIAQVDHDQLPPLLPQLPLDFLPGKLQPSPTPLWLQRTVHRQ